MSPDNARWKIRAWSLAAALAAVGLVGIPPLGAADVPSTATIIPEPPPGFVRFNLQGNIKLQALLDIVSARLGTQFIYSAQIADRQINVKAPNQIPVEALPALFASVLKMENLLLIDADVPGWKRIVDVGEMPQVAATGEAEKVLKQSGPATPVTQAFVIEHMSVTQLAQLIRPFLRPQGANAVPVPETNVLVVTDYAPTVLTIERLIKLIDRPRGEVVYEFYTVTNTESKVLAEQVRSMLGGRPVAAPGASAAPPPPIASAGLGPMVELFSEPRTNQIVVVGQAPLVQKAVELLKRFDVSLGTTTKVYRLQYVKAERLDRIMKGAIPPQDVERVYRASIDEEGNLLVVRATPEIHQRLEELQKQLDVPVKVEESPIRFYKLKNANATDVLYTLLALQETGGVTTSAFGGRGGAPAPIDMKAAGPKPDGAGGLSININPTPSTGGLGMGGLGANSLGSLGGLSGGLSGSGMGSGLGAVNRPFRMPLSPTEDPTGSYNMLQDARQDRMTAVMAPQFAGGGMATLPGGARVSANIASNSLVIVAPTEVQELYARLIQQLDVRQPQVLIDAKIVAVDTSDNFTLGVEISGGDRTGNDKLFAFTSFGLSQVNPLTGALTIIPGNGFNGTLVNPDIADVVIRALSTHSRARVLAAPRILVNDNTTGQLESVTSIPFQSVNASQTVSTTSLGGSQQAGTVITVTPHIKENDHLQLEFSIEFSTFTGTATANLPPPRQIDRIGSVVTLPNGQTIIAGGLKRIADTHNNTGVPYLENIPVVRELTSLNNHIGQTMSFFIFLRPLVLRDDRFADLKYLSETSVHGAALQSDWPTSKPKLIE